MNESLDNFDVSDISVGEDVDNVDVDTSVLLEEDDRKKISLDREENIDEVMNNFQAELEAAVDSEDVEQVEEENVWDFEATNEGWKNKQNEVSYGKFDDEDFGAQDNVSDDFAAITEEDDITDKTEDFGEEDILEDKISEETESFENYDEIAQIAEEVNDEYAELDVVPEYSTEQLATDEFENDVFVQDDVDNFEDYKNVNISNIEQSGSVGFLKWYSGSSNDAVYEFDKNSESGSFYGDENCNVLHVNVGYDTYGWEVQFPDGVIMNLRDVREYQIRNGRLPNTEGRLIYGQKNLMFSGVKRIVVYESVRYFSYGV